MFPIFFFFFLSIVFESPTSRQMPGGMVEEEGGSRLLGHICVRHSAGVFLQDVSHPPDPGAYVRSSEDKSGKYLNQHMSGLCVHMFV